MNSPVSALNPRPLGPTPARRIIVALCALVLFASACGSSGPVTPDGLTTTDDASTTTGDADAIAGDGTSEDSTEAVAGDAAGSDDAADQDGATDATAPAAEPGSIELDSVSSITDAELVTNLVADLTGHVVSEGEQACMLDATETDAEVQGLFDSLRTGAPPADDSGLRGFTYAANGCVDPQALGVYAAGGIGLDPAERPEVVECFAAEFAKAEGDRVLHTLVAVSNGFDNDADSVDPTVDSLGQCAPLTAIAEPFARQTELASNFTVEVDRDCLVDSLDEPTLTEEFWRSALTGEGAGMDAIDAANTECSTQFDSGLLQELPADFVEWSGTGALADVEPTLRAGLYSAPPPMVIDPDGSYEAVIVTGGSEIRIELFADSAPITVNNFVSLARDGYYDNTVFHRVLADFMAQGGDPTGTGTGGPGYQFEDEVDGGPALDRAGLLAMANAGPGTNGSQFFITFAPTDWLTGNHTVFGEIIEGEDVASAIELRDPAAPATRGQLIESVTIIEG